MQQIKRLTIGTKDIDNHVLQKENLQKIDQILSNGKNVVDNLETLG